MKTFKYLGTLLLLAMAWACSNDNEIVKPESVQPVSDGITFTATFSVKNGTSRALSDPDDGTLKASWQQGEEIAIVFEGGDKYTATVTEVDAEGSATVTATLPAGTHNKQPVIYIYPASAADENGLRGDVLSSQDGTFATLSSTLDIATANGTLVVDGTTAQPNGTVTLVNQFAICKFQFTDENDQAIENITSLTITDLATTEVITVTTPSPMAAVYVAMMPSNNSTKFEVTDAEGNIYQKTSSAHLEAGMFYRPTLKATKDHMYVDLGLPSGTLWATCNVGANSPEEYGDYFAWGETEPKSTYTGETYRYYFEEMLTKYCFNSEYGYNNFTDGLTELEAEDDAATANWGEPWHTPTKTQILELIDKCTIEWTTKNNISGLLVTSPNGNTIFLPATGRRREVYEEVGTYGRYWSSTLSASTTDACYLNFGSYNSGYWMWADTFREDGLTVRPVRKQ